MTGNLIYEGIFLIGVIISSFSQIVLKKAALSSHDSLIREYLNLPVIFSYLVFVIATFCSMYAYKGIPLSMGPVLESTQYFFIAILSYVFLKEQISKQKVIGISVVVIGVLIYSI
ncbi:MAG: EamA family transporter [Clostridiales Family XIII bacterium]|nr:EamA family transporter [Clostridia bacterium]MDE8733863.1 EamA family transporter [Eubacteriales bacterium DFI.9.88]MDY3011063.1 EamA family transporter [Clostridiales Family XIII bacterium]